MLALVLAAVFADPSAAARGADGSAERPFPTVAAAVAAAREGETIELGPGVFRESVHLARALVLRGRAQGLTFIEPPEGPGITVQGASGVVVRDLSVRGGPVGIQILGGYGHSIFRTHLSGQQFGGIALVEAEAEIALCSLLEIGLGQRGGKDSHGIDALGGALWVTDSTLVRAGRRSIRFHETYGGARGNYIEGAGQNGIAVAGGARVSVSGNRVVRAGGAAIYAFGGARLLAQGNQIEGGEFGLLGGRGAEMVALANTARDSARAGIAFVNAARGVADGNSLHNSGISLLEPFHVEVAHNSIYAPAMAGIHMVGGTARIEENDIGRAVRDRDGDFGNGIYVDRAEVELRGNRVLENSGAGMVLASTTALVSGNDVRQNGGDGAVVRGLAEVRLVGNDFAQNGGNGVAVADKGAAVLVQNRLTRNSGRGVESRCGEEVSVVLSGNLSLGNVRGAGGGCP